MASVSLFCSFLPFVGLCLCVLHGVDAGIINGSDRHEMKDFYWFGDEESEMTKKSCEFAQARGYICEEHEVETKDGYILTLHRLPVKDKKDCKTRDKVVLLNHGLLASSTNFLINSPKQSLGYLFSDACYDVWLANARGNVYSLKHNTYTSDDEEFWKFSFDEMAEYDMPAIVDYVLQKTNQKSLYYIGYSQGTTIGFEAFSENKTLAKKIRFFGALAAVGYAGYMKTQATTYSAMSDQAIYLLFGRKSLFAADWKMEMFIKTTCTNSLTRGTCVEMGEILLGKFSPHFNKTRIGVYMMHALAGSSIQNLVHWAQMMRTKKTQKYFYLDHLNNVARYGSWKPPDINFSQMNLPVAVFTGGNDIIADEKDTSRLISELPNLVTQIRISDYSHWDFLYATNVAETIFKPLSLLMKNY